MNLLEHFGSHPQAGILARSADALHLSDAENASLKALSAMFPPRDALLLVLLARQPAVQELSATLETVVPAPASEPVPAAPVEAPAAPEPTPDASQPAEEQPTAPVLPAVSGGAA